MWLEFIYLKIFAQRFIDTYLSQRWRGNCVCHKLRNTCTVRWDWSAPWRMGIQWDDPWLSNIVNPDYRVSFQALKLCYYNWVFQRTLRGPVCTETQDFWHLYVHLKNLMGISRTHIAGGGIALPQSAPNQTYRPGHDRGTTVPILGLKVGV